MAHSCAICLSPYDSLVSTPCGHIFCQACISEYILVRSNGFSSSCPTCRENFPIATPELEHLPRSFHRFIFPGIRRVFLDTSPDPEIDNLKQELKTAKDRIILEQQHLEEQSKVYSLALSQLSDQLEAEKKQGEEFRVAFAEMTYHKDKYIKLRKAFDDILSHVTSGVKRRRSDSTGNLDDNRHSDRRSLRSRMTKNLAQTEEYQRSTVTASTASRRRQSIRT
ncbi:uncharacterized protein EV420DRAFT_1505787 [Desarmillaria tabescens]|uniref:RING-type domain-containing protein n=1 Tax=Armillaria tabescens TaxID=1929756 RepID=A0AA39T608_ARMTA|nr:uncharacterized protein EV420DRAFT_1505787 [Desarmillaria tabescens]KAK0466856.1 hypothetical protein EV420DRAFT_1505787 [Desarmillaria tabescens]